MNANDDLRDGYVCRALAIDDLREVIPDHHHSHLLTQATYHRNQQNKSMDGIFISRGNAIKASRYYKFGVAASSVHSALLVDIASGRFLGYVSRMSTPLQHNR